MKIEMDDNTGITVTICMIATIILLGSLGGCYMSEKTNQEAIKAGLVQKPMQSQAGSLWSKP